MTKENIMNSDTCGYCIRTLRFAAMLPLLLLLHGCFSSDEPVLMEREKAGPLSIFSDKVHDISGTYYQMDGKKESKPVTFTRDDTRANVFLTGKAGGTGKTDRVLVENLSGDKTLLMQQQEKSQYTLIPAKMVDEGLRLFIPIDMPGKKKNVFDEALWASVLAKHGLAVDSKNRLKFVRGQLSASDYTAKVKAVFDDMLAANALGEGLLLMKADLYQAAREKEERRQSFVTLCASATLDQIQKALQDGADPNARNQDGITPLMSAAQSNPNPEVLTSLIKAGGDISMKTERGHTLLMLTRKNPEFKAVAQTLLSAGAEVDARDSEGKTAFMLAIADQNISFAELMLQAKADINALDTSGTSALVSAARYGTAEIIDFLLRAGADAKSKDTSGKSIFELLLNRPEFYSAANEKNNDLLFRLLQNGENINTPIGSSGDTLIMRAAKGATPEGFAGLLRFSPDLRLKNKYGDTAFTIYNTSYRKGKVPLLQWVLPKIDDPAIVEMLVTSGADINADSPQGETALMKATGREQTAVLKKLLELGADPNALTTKKRTALHYAVENDNPDAVRALLQAGAKPIDTAGIGNTEILDLLRQGAAPAVTEKEPAKPSSVPAASAAPVTQSTALTLPSYPPLVPGKDGKPKTMAHKLRFEKGVVDLALQILAPGKTVEAVRIDNVGGVSAAWRSDGKDSAAPLTVMDGDASLADGTAAVALALGEAEKLLRLTFTDNGAVAGGDTDLRVTVFFTDKNRAMYLLSK